MPLSDHPPSHSLGLNHSLKCHSLIANIKAHSCILDNDIVKRPQRTVSNSGLNCHWDTAKRIYDYFPFSCYISIQLQEL